jgi:predicted  nucleic acid-binding Zn-ribbon protein
MDSQQYITLGSALAVLSVVYPIWKDSKEHEKRVSTLENEIKFLTSGLNHSMANVEKIETRLEGKITNLEADMARVLVALARIEAKLEERGGK